MLKAIPRYGARVLPNTEQLVGAVRRAGHFIEGPHVQEFESAFARRLGDVHAVSTSFGRMAFYYILKALDLGRGGEVVLPALTFWVIPEIARVAGFTPVFADVDPDTFTMTPETLARVVGPKTVAVVPTHLWGLPCDMDGIMDIARARRLAVIEDCAHALGATYKGRQVGTIGDAALFSFQTLKPLNTYGGGMAVARDAALAERIGRLARAEPLPTDQAVRKKLWQGRVQRISIRPGVFTFSLFPILWASAYLNTNPDVFLWEKIRPLDPLPAGYRERYANVQAALGLEALKHLDTWTGDTQTHAAEVTRRLADVPGARLPHVPADRTHVFYQYCAYFPDRDATVLNSLKRGVDLETLHVDVCATLPLFEAFASPAPGAEATEQAVQIPVYESLDPEEVARVASVVHDAAMPVGIQDSKCQMQDSKTAETR
jgi:dTDP-4-amino-4,6-dideoxygalactose transaminase